MCPENFIKEKIDLMNEAVLHFHGSDHQALLQLTSNSIAFYEEMNEEQEDDEVSFDTADDSDSEDDEMFSETEKILKKLEKALHWNGESDS